MVVVVVVVVVIVVVVVVAVVIATRIKHYKGDFGSSCNHKRYSNTLYVGFNQG